MPIIKESSYTKRPWYYFNAYLETLGPYFMSRTNAVSYERERLELEDGDFLDLDWIKGGSKYLVIISHGLEGNSKDHFIEKSASYLSMQYDMLVWHYRSCSQELNRLPRFYHSGDVSDLSAAITHAKRQKRYAGIFLLGFSIGGSITVNYMASKLVDPAIRAGVAFSTPMDLAAASSRMNHGINICLKKGFLAKWKRKIRRKANMFPNAISVEGLDEIQDLEELLEKYVFMADGYSSKEEYYEKWSSLQFLSEVTRPLLVVNSENDPLLSEHCFPEEYCKNHKWVYLETPKYGGHTGFSKKKEGMPWYVYRTAQFIESAQG